LVKRTSTGLALPLVTVVALSSSALAIPDHEDDAAFIEQRAQQATQRLAKALASRLKASMRVGGPLAAIDTCHVEAPGITETTGEAEGLVVARTALRVRNPANTPDEWEQTQLERFSTALAEGAAPGSLSALERVDTGGGDHVWRYMQPILTGGLCLQCHGDVLAPEVAAAIAERYPNDQATGFALSSLRGAFTVTITE
jgi:hypothetical protein